MQAPLCLIASHTTGPPSTGALGGRSYGRVTSIPKADTLLPVAVTGLSCEGAGGGYDGSRGHPLPSVPYLLGESP